MSLGSMCLTTLASQCRLVLRFPILRLRHRPNALVRASSDLPRSTEAEAEAETSSAQTPPRLLHFHPGLSPSWREKFLSSFRVMEDFVTEAEEAAIIKEVEPHLGRMFYEKDHWDEAIVGFRETERRHWNKANSAVVSRILETAFRSPFHQPLPYTHVLDLAEDGRIKPHVDSARFCGDVVAVLSLLSQSVARFVVEKDKTHRVDCLLPRRSLYIMKGSARYEFTHEILSNEQEEDHQEESALGVTTTKGRRVSLICRCQPDASRAAQS